MSFLTIDYNELRLSVPRHDDQITGHHFFNTQDCHVKSGFQHPVQRALSVVACICGWRSDRHTSRAPLMLYDDQAVGEACDGCGRFWIDHVNDFARTKGLEIHLVVQ